MKREMTEPESLVFAAAFGAACVQGANHRDALADGVRAVQTLRSIRVRDRRDHTHTKMLQDFRMDEPATPSLSAADAERLVVACRLVRRLNCSVKGRLTYQDRTVFDEFNQVVDDVIISRDPSPPAPRTCDECGGTPCSMGDCNK